MLQESKRRYGKTFRAGSSTAIYKVDERVDPRLRTTWFLPRAPDEPIRSWVARNLELSPACRAMDAAMVVLSFVMVEFFLYTNWKAYSIDLDPNIQTASNVIGVLFTLDYIVRLYAAPLRKEHATSLFAMVDFIGVASAWIEILVDKLTMATLKTDTSGRQFLSMLQVMKSLRILRAYRLLRFTSSMVQRQILATVLTIVCIMIAVAGALQNLELCPANCPDICIPLYRNDTTACNDVTIEFPDHPEVPCQKFINYTLYPLGNVKVTNCCLCQVYGFLDWIYFVVVTMSTLGYGDISPKTLAGRLGTAILIMMAFVVVPIQVNKLVSTISQHSRYNKAYTGRNDTHGVITAHHLDTDMLHTFLRQFFHPENRNWNERMIILYPQEPSAEITKMIHMYEPRVTYIVGSAMQEPDLKRAAVPNSAVCYVLTAVSDNTDRADQMSSILTTAFRALNKSVPIFTQVIRSTSVSYCTISGANNVVCVQKLKMSILALSCGIKGLTTLLSNLVTTFSPPTRPFREPWCAAYVNGAINKVFRIAIPRSFSGLTYHELVMFLYNNLQIITIAMETPDGIQLNPMEFKLGQTADPKTCCTVYIIAPDLQIVDRIAEYQLEQIRVFRQTLRKMERARDDAAGYDKPKTPKKSRRHKKLTLGGHLYRPVNLSSLASGTKSVYELFIDKVLPPVLEKHIVIIGLPFALQDLLEPLRNKSDHRAVVILSPTPLSEADFEGLDHVEQTYFVRGSPLSSFDLQRVHITSAASVIVLATIGNKREFYDENMVDADAITCVRFILEACSLRHKRAPNLVVELVKHTNVRFLSMLVKTVSRKERRLTDHMAASSAHLDMDDDEVEEMGLPDDEDNQELIYICQPAFASGRVCVNGMIEALMSECYQMPNLPVIIEALLHGQETDVEKLQLFQIPCPKALANKAFGECFRKLLRLNYICIGCWHAEQFIATQNKRIPAFVHMNPTTDSKIDERDLLYVIGKPTNKIEL
ncbi:Aste57867_22042 [Aphanomyces stellatus]|uniref:Aste57867_22042 protein n=1 Tax=Aphanomyces stellatus TaxID=120398 RepID=A0A485LKH7_9STRA|nr:hypothetical protein As57867_021973 [Aphanomyces stellatus]VFT98710.1 Aste57867_22042 [Aphanomyces stellatus]